MEQRLQWRRRHRPTAHGRGKYREAVGVGWWRWRHDQSRLPGGHLQCIRRCMHLVREGHPMLCLKSETGPVIERWCTPPVDGVNGGRRDGCGRNEARRRTRVAAVARHVELMTTKHGHHHGGIGRNTRSTAAAGSCHAWGARHARTTRLRLRHGGRGRVLETVTAVHLLCLLDPFSTLVRFGGVDDLVSCATNALRYAVRAGHIGVLADKSVQGTFGTAVLGREESEHVASDEVVSHSSR